nr:extracellular solute-binding protein [uncultured Blautia sp.]
MKRRKVTACAMAALMAMGLVGTVMPVYAKSNLKNVDDVVEIKMAVWTSGAADIYNKAAEGFNQTHDNIKLSVEMQSGDYNQYLGAKTAAKDLFKKAGIEKVPETFDEMKAVCEKLQAANITPFTAIYKDNWTVSQEFCSLFGGVLGGKDKIDSWLDSMNKGEGSFKVDGVDRVFDFMDLMKENSGQNYMDSDAATGFYAFANQEAAMIFLSDAATISVGSVTQDLPIGFFAVPVSDNADDAEVVACATDAIVANANGEHLDEALEVLDYIGDGGDWLKTVTNSYGGFMACMDIEADDEIASKDYYKDLKAYMDAGKVRSTLWNQLPSGASDVLGDDVQGYFAGITDEDQTLDALDEGFKKLAEE